MVENEVPHRALDRRDAAARRKLVELTGADRRACGARRRVAEPVDGVQQHAGREFAGEPAAGGERSEPVDERLSDIGGRPDLDVGPENVEKRPLQAADDLGASRKPIGAGGVRRRSRPIRVIPGITPSNQQRVLDAEHAGAVGHDDLRGIGDEDAGVDHRRLRNHLRDVETALWLPGEDRAVVGAGDESAAEIIERPVYGCNRRSRGDRRRHAETVTAETVAAIAVALAAVVRAGCDVVEQPSITAVHRQHGAGRRRHRRGDDEIVRIRDRRHSVETGKREAAKRDGDADRKSASDRKPVIGEVHRHRRQTYRCREDRNSAAARDRRSRVRRRCNLVGVRRDGLDDRIGAEQNDAANADLRLDQHDIVGRRLTVRVENRDRRASAYGREIDGWICRRSLRRDVVEDACGDDTELLRRADREVENAFEILPSVHRRDGRIDRGRVETSPATDLLDKAARCETHQIARLETCLVERRRLLGEEARNKLDGFHRHEALRPCRIELVR